MVPHPKFSYNCEDLLNNVIIPFNSSKCAIAHEEIENGLEFISDASPQVEDEDSATFDQLLMRLWNKAQNDGVFRYKHKSLPSKILGPHCFLAQLNTDRAEKRRKAQEVHSLHQPFNPELFNFNKVPDSEILLTLNPCNGSLEDGKEHLVIINVSPLGAGHVLLTPFVWDNLPQIVTLDGLRLAFQFLLLSRSPDFRVGFNSLGGFASVNHQHYHAYYLSYRLKIEYMSLKPSKSNCFEIGDNYPAKGFAFVFTNDQKMDSFLANAFNLISHLETNDIAHNVFITRGSSANEMGHFDSVRLYVWAREAYYGTKESAGFNPALCELAGHFPIKEKKYFETINGENLAQDLEKITLPEFNKIQQNISNILPKS